MGPPVTRALGRGVIDAVRAWRLIASLWAALLLAILPAGVTMFASLREAIGARGVAERLRGTMDLVWLGEYREAARGLAATVDVPVLTRSALLVNLEDWWRGDLTGSPALVLGLGLLWIAVWTFAGGVALDRFLFGTGPRGPGRWAVAGCRHFWRLARLAVLSLPAYWLVYRFASWLFPFLERRLRDVTEERWVLGWYLAGAALVVLLLGAVGLWFDYARIVAVRREIRSSPRALAESARWLGRHPLAAVALQVALGAAAGAIAVAYLLLAPDPVEESWTGVAIVFLGGQAAVAARLALLVAGWAARCRLYRVLER